MYLWFDISAICLPCLRNCVLQTGFENLFLIWTGLSVLPREPAFEPAFVTCNRQREQTVPCSYQQTNPGSSRSFEKYVERKTDEENFTRVFVNTRLIITNIGVKDYVYTRKKNPVFLLKTLSRSQTVQFDPTEVSKLLRSIDKHML